MIDSWIAVSAAYLTSKKAKDSLALDPYWPKWDSPWWHMSLLWEIGRADLIGRPVIRKMTEAHRSHFLDHFPLTSEEVPPGIDRYRDISCHCALGNMYQILDACCVDV